VSSKLTDRLIAAVAEHHCVNHPMTEKWARGELSRNAMLGWATEHYHWVSHMDRHMFYVCAHAPGDVVSMELGNVREEFQGETAHTEIVLRFAQANGGDVSEIRAGRGLPTTEAWVAWLLQVAKEESWIAAVAAMHVGTESQSPALYSRLLPALRNHYKFPEESIEHFWLHVDADSEHGGAAFDVLEKYCTTPELQELAVHYARETARMRWFYFDGIYLHYEMNYPFIRG
jgi:pyrroloquinoline-quinone synthase